jgi:hypothetical protein
MIVAIQLSIAEARNLFAASSLLNKSMACSHGPAIAADRPIGPSVAANDDESASDCLLNCLYHADRCDRQCAGCTVTASAGRAARASLRCTPVAAVTRLDTPPSNTGVNKEGVGHGD